MRIMARNLIVVFLTCGINVSLASIVVVKLNDGKQMPVLALGTWLGLDPKLGFLYPKDNKVEQAVVWAIEAGYRHIDTASVYRTEGHVGRALTKKFSEGLKREDIYVTTKLYNDAHAKDAVVPALRSSLKNLNLDYVDMYLIHYPLALYPNGTNAFIDYLDTWRGMIEAKNLGLTKSIGLSNFNKEQIGRLLEQGLEKPATLQVEINLNLQQPELLAYCKEQQIEVMAYTPFGSLFYNKALPDAPPPRVDDTALVHIANKYNKTVPQVNLRYLMELGLVVIAKSVSKSRIEENINIFDFELTSSERELLKGYDKHYRTLPFCEWSDYPDYPFEKNERDRLERFSQCRTILPSNPLKVSFG